MRILQPSPAGSGVVFKDDFYSCRTTQDQGGIIVASTVDRGISPLGASARVTYKGTESLLANATQATWRVKLRTASVDPGNTPLLTKSPVALTDNQFELVLAAGVGGRPYISVSNAPGDSSQYCVANDSLLQSTVYVLHFVYNGALAAASRVLLYVNGLAVPQTIGGIIPTILRWSSMPLVLFQRTGGSTIAPPTSTVVYDLEIRKYALNPAEVYDDAFNLTHGKLVT